MVSVRRKVSSLRASYARSNSSTSEPVSAPISSVCSSLIAAPSPATKGCPLSVTAPLAICSQAWRPGWLACTTVSPAPRCETYSRASWCTVTDPSLPSGDATSLSRPCFSADGKKQGRLRLVASPDGSEGSVTVHQDARLYVSHLGAGDTVVHASQPGRHAWLQIASGAVTLNGQPLVAGDGAAISDEQTLEIGADTGSEVLLFDLA